MEVRFINTKQNKSFYLSHNIHILSSTFSVTFTCSKFRQMAFLYFLAFQILHLIYPVELVVKDFPNSVSYLELYLEHDINGTLKTKLYDTRGYFNFPIVNYPFRDSNIRHLLQNTLNIDSIFENL